MAVCCVTDVSSFRVGLFGSLIKVYISQRSTEILGMHFGVFATDSNTEKLNFFFTEIMRKGEEFRLIIL